MTLTQLPIACSLSASELPARIAEMTACGRTALIGSRVDGAAATLRFRPETGLLVRLRAIVAAESRCCPFLAIELREEPAQIIVRIDAPAGGEPILAELVAAFDPRRRRTA